MKTKNPTARPLAGLAVMAGLALFLAACQPSTEAKQAITDAQNNDATFAFLSSAGGSLGLRESLPGKFPQVGDLIQPDSNAQATMLGRLRTGGMDDDIELCIYAYALEQLGDKSAVAPLRQFVGRSIGGPFTWSPYFAAHAVLSLSGLIDDATDINWYGIPDMRAIANTGKVTAATVSGSEAAAAQRDTSSCTLRYLLVDANNHALYLKDGKTRAIVEGFNRSCPRVPQVTTEHFNTTVENGGGLRYSGGTIVADGEFGNAPNRQFDCAGYALRELNNYHKWWVNPTSAFRALYEAGALEEILGPQAVKGDKVFFFKDETSTLPDHVAEVHVPGGMLPATIWNADEMSGLWEATTNAAYFSDKGLNKARFYRWKNGVPKIIPDPEFADDPNNCQVNPVTDGECPSSTTTTTIAVKENSCPANGALCQWSGGPATGSNWNSYAMIAWSSETKLEQIDYEATNFVTGAYINWNITFSGGEPFNATLTVTHNKITGSGGSGTYKTSSTAKELQITGADINLNFSGWNLTGTLIVHTEDGKQATVEVKAAHKDGTYP